MTRFFLGGLVFVASLSFLSNANARDGVYMTLESGWANQPTLASAAQVGALRREDPSFPAAYRGAIGYNHDFLKWLGVGFEVAWGHYGGTVYYFPTGTVKITSTTVEFLTKTMFHLNKKIDLLLTLGGIRHTTKIRGLINRSGSMRIQPEVGIGTVYNFNRNFGITANYNHTFGRHLRVITGNQRAEPSLNEYLLGVRITFG